MSFPEVARPDKNMDCQQRYQGQAALDRTSEVDRNGKHFKNQNKIKT